MQPYPRPRKCFWCSGEKKVETFLEKIHRYDFKEFKSCKRKTSRISSLPSITPVVFISFTKTKSYIFLKKKKIIIKVTLLKGPLIRKERNMVPNRLEFF